MRHPDDQGPGSYTRWLASAQSADEPVPFSLLTAATVDEALDAVADGAAVMAGGTELLLEMRRQTRSPRQVVSLAAVDELRHIRLGDDGRLRVGAAVRLADIAADETVLRAAPALAAAALSVATPQIRAQATVGGNLLQLQRCLYLWRGIPCRRSHGSGCPAAQTGTGVTVPLRLSPKCHAVQGSDMAAALMVLDGEIEVASSGSRQALPVADFYSPGPAGQANGAVLGHDQLVTGATVSSRRWTVSGYRNGNLPNGSPLDSLGVAVGLAVDGGYCVDAKAVIAGAADTPWPLPGFSECLRGLPVHAASARAEDCVRHGSSRFTYRHGLLCELLEQVLDRLAVSADTSGSGHRG